MERKVVGATHYLSVFLSASLVVDLVEVVKLVKIVTLVKVVKLAKSVQLV